MINKDQFKAVLFCLFLAAFVMASAMALSSCTPHISPGLPEPTPAVSPTPPSSSPPSPSIDAIVTGSACAKYDWKNRGRAPIGFVKGLAYSFSRSVCNQWPVMTKALGDTDHDALAWYGKEATLLNTYTLLLGLGMRESSGNYGEGYDTSAGPETASEAEAGAFQFSYNSVNASKDLRELYSKFRGETGTCMLEVFKEGAPGSHQSIRGSGEGADFQAFTKSCPAFSAQYAATLIRVLRRHFGPVNRKEAEFRDECAAMFKQVAASTVCK